jgi:hypothetical protein
VKGISAREREPNVEIFLALVLGKNSLCPQKYLPNFQTKRKRNWEKREILFHFFPIG